MKETKTGRRGDVETRRRQNGGWRVYYRLGVLTSKRLPTYASFGDVGRYLGKSKQNAYTECMLALGKLVLRMKCFPEGRRRE